MTQIYKFKLVNRPILRLCKIIYTFSLGWPGERVEVEDLGQAKEGDRGCGSVKNNIWDDIRFFFSFFGRGESCFQEDMIYFFPLLNIL